MADADVHRSARWLLPLALVLTALVYVDTLRFEFISDDFPQIVDNPAIRSWASVPGFFTHHVWDVVISGATGNFYRPLFLVWFVAIYKLVGLNLLGWHLATLLVHLTVTFLVGRIATRVLQSEAAGGVAALVFGVHPIHIETVTWVSGVTDSLLAVFFCAAFLAWLRSRGSAPQRAGFVALALFWYALALLVKEPAVVLPLLIFGYVAISERDHSTRERATAALRASLPFVLVTVCYLALRARVLHGLTHPMTVLPWKTVVLTAPSLVWFYITHLAWPFRIAALYETPYVTAPGAAFWAPLLLSLVVIAAGLAWWQLAHDGAVLFGLWWIVLPLLPALNIDVFLYRELAHDRYAYLPSVGFALLVAVALQRWQQGEKRLLGLTVPTAAITLVIVLVYAIATSLQNVQWSNELLLYARASAAAPNNVHAVAPLARALIKRRRYAEAVPVLERSVQLVPGDRNERVLLAQMCYLAREYEKAEKYFLGAIAMGPGDTADYFLLGQSQAELKKYDAAVAALRKAIELSPTRQGLHLALARVLRAAGDIAGARRELEAELRVDPNNGDARRELTALP